jgi:hypothetical protein
VDDVLQSNVDDARFAEQDLAAPIDWGDGSTPYWCLSLAEALVEALPYVLSRTLGR